MNPTKQSRVDKYFKEYKRPDAITHEMKVAANMLLLDREEEADRQAKLRLEVSNFNSGEFPAIDTAKFGNTGKFSLHTEPEL